MVSSEAERERLEEQLTAVQVCLHLTPLLSSFCLQLAHATCSAIHPRVLNIGAHILLVARCCCIYRRMLGRHKMLPQLWQAWRVSWNRQLGVRSSSELAGPSVSTSSSKLVRWLSPR